MTAKEFYAKHYKVNGKSPVLRSSDHIWFDLYDKVLELEKTVKQGEMRLVRGRRRNYIMIKSNEN